MGSELGCFRIRGCIGFEACGFAALAHGARQPKSKWKKPRGSIDYGGSNTSRTSPCRIPGYVPRTATIKIEALGRALTLGCAGAPFTKIFYPYTKPQTPYTEP